MSELRLRDRVFNRNIGLRNVEQGKPFLGGRVAENSKGNLVFKSHPEAEGVHIKRIGRRLPWGEKRVGIRTKQKNLLGQYKYKVLGSYKDLSKALAGDKGAGQAIAGALDDYAQTGGQNLQDAQRWRMAGQTKLWIAGAAAVAVGATAGTALPLAAGGAGAAAIHTAFATTLPHVFNTIVGPALGSFFTSPLGIAVTAGVGTSILAGAGGAAAGATVGYRAGARSAQTATP